MADAALVELACALTPKQRKFCEAVATGRDLSEAYRDAYRVTQGTPQTVGKNASRLRAQPQIEAYIGALVAKNAKRAEFGRAQKLKLLEDAMQGDKPLTGNQLKAVEIHNRMTGDEEPIAVKVSGLAELLGLVRKASK